MPTADSDPAGARILLRAFQAQAALGVLASMVTFFAYGRFSAQSVAFGAGFAALHLFTVMRSVQSSYGNGVSPAATFFVVLRSVRFMIVLAGAALVLIAGFASPVAFLFGYALLVPAIASSVLQRPSDQSGDEP